jgi:uncharacterized protein (TIGR02231 family)
MKAASVFQTRKEGWVWFLAFLTALLLAPRVFAEVRVATSPQQVTVFPDSARVIREGSVRLLAGGQHVVFPDLPASLIESSLRLSVEGPAGTKFYGVGLRNEFTPDIVEKRTKLLKDQLQILEDQKADRNDRIEARKTEIEILKGLAKQGTDTVHDHPSTLPDFTRNAGSVGIRIAKLLAANRLDERAVRSLDLKIAALNNRINQGSSQAREKRAAEADLELPQAGLTRFTLTYQVSGASWTPLYDLRLGTESEKPNLDLAFNAGVRQTTGEDWKNVALTLSTARPTQGTQLPDPTDWWLDFLNQQVYRAKKAFGLAKSMEARVDNFTATNAGEKDEEDEPALAPAPVETAQTVRSEYAVAYKVLSRRDIPSDGSDHRVGVSENSYPVKLTLVAVPRLSEAAYLEAKVTYMGDQTLLPGLVQLYRDGDFVGTTGLEAKAPGESFELGFGQDDQIRVTRKAVKYETGDAQGIFDINKGERRYRWVTTVANYHIGAREVEIREQLPRSRQQNIEVTLGDLAPKAAAPDPAKPGLVAWDLTLNPKQKAQVDFSYRVKYPEGTQVTGLE